MKPIPFKECKFLLSSLGTGVPKKNIPHLIVAGRSNVGKSSFINHLFGNRSLARVSSVPGKTRLINFFLVDESLFLVDLPGYGYAKVSKQEQSDWQDAIELYLHENNEKVVILHLLDSRHPPSDEDLRFIEWARDLDKKILFVFTKIDKIKKNKQQIMVKELASLIGSGSGYLPFSIEEGHYRKLAIAKINEWLVNGET